MGTIEVLLRHLVPMALVGFATSHGSFEAHKQAPIVDPGADWATRHMAGSHTWLPVEWDPSNSSL